MEIQAKFNWREGFSSQQFFNSAGVREFVIISEDMNDFNAVGFICRMKLFIARNNFRTMK